MRLTKKHYNLLAFAIVIVITLWQWLQNQPVTDTSTSEGFLSVQEARQQQLRDVYIQGSGEVIRLLADDLKGSRHQRILIEEPSGKTLLVVHNIDLAPRINSIRVGDKLFYQGEYIWNEKGGLVHWTHHDPRGNEIGGWLEHMGKRYE